jgi:hypothetical protein
VCFTLAAKTDDDCSRDTSCIVFLVSKLRALGSYEFLEAAMPSYHADPTAEQVKSIVRTYSHKLEAEGTTTSIETALVKQENRDKAASDADNVRYKKWNAFLLSAPEPQ